MKRLSLFAGSVLLALTLPAHGQDRFPSPSSARPNVVQQQQSPAAERQAPDSQRSAAPANAEDRMTAAERRDYGVAAIAQLYDGAMHGPTPASIPGGQLITTKGLIELMDGGQTPFLLLDILGGQEVIPGAVYAVPAHQAGSFNDQTQQEFGGFLQQMTGGNRQTPLVLYCASTECWMSYNAALRAINLGYTNVLWYRGGIEAWKAAGRQTQPAQ